MGIFRPARCPFGCGAERGFCRCGTGVGRNPDRAATKTKVIRNGKAVPPPRKRGR